MFDYSLINNLKYIICTKVECYIVLSDDSQFRLCVMQGSRIQGSIRSLSVDSGYLACLHCALPCRHYTPSLHTHYIVPPPSPPSVVSSFYGR